MQFISKAFALFSILLIHPVLNAQAIPDPSDEVELTVSMSVESTEVKPGDPINYSVTVSNLSTSVVATNVVLKLTYLPGSQISLPQEPVSACEEDGEVFTCAISELTPLASIEIAVSARAGSDRSRIYIAGGVVDSDQPLNPPSDSLFVREFIPIEHPETPEEPEPAELYGTVDLGVEVLSSRITESESVYTMRVFNLHEDNVATAPVVDIILDEQEAFISSDSCAGDGQAVHCDLSEIGPGGDYTFEIFVTGFSEKITMRMEVGSPQPDRNTNNNVYRSTKIVGAGISNNAAIVDVPEGEPQGQETPIQTDNSLSSGEPPILSGAGAFSYQFVLLLLFIIVSRCPLRAKRNY